MKEVNVRRRIAEEASEILGGYEKALLWLSTPNKALGGQAPIALLETDHGVRQVEEILGRIEYGVYS